MTYYLAQLSNGKLISRSSNRSDFTHAAVWPPRLAYGLPSFGTSPQGARKNAESSTPQANLMDIEVAPVRIVDAKEYNAARKYAKAHNGMAPEAKPIAGERVVIDCTPTWSGLLPAFLAVLEDGTAEGRAIARQELTRMAALADAYVASQKQEA